MLPTLQTLHISQYEFEEFCERWAFVLHEKLISTKFNGDYDQFWKEFYDINPNIWVKYVYTTSLGTKVRFQPSSNSKWETFWEYVVFKKEKRKI
jgi:hypothetical protein